MGLEWHTAIAYFANTHKSWEIMLFHCGEGLSAGGSIASVSHFSPSCLGTNSAWLVFVLRYVVYYLVPRFFAILALPL